MAGQGTAALELLEQAPGLDLLLAPVGGGGLIAGCATAAKALRPDIRVVGIEPEAGDDTRRSLAAGERVRIETPRTIADGQQSDIPGRLTFEVNRRLVDAVELVSDAEIVAAMAFLFDRMKLVAEPSGVSALAALLAGRVSAPGRPGGRDRLGRQRRRLPVLRAARPPGRMTEPDRDFREAESERVGPGPPVAPGGVRRLLRLATMDVGPLRRRRDFRLLWIGQGVSFFGSMITYVALPYQAYQLSGSSLVVGLLGLAELAPLLVAAFIGGALADAVDRRRMMQVTELLFAVASMVLVANALLPHPQLWLLFVMSVLLATLDGLQRPSLDALTPRLVERDELPAAGALASFRMTIGMIAGPAVGGVLVATAGLPATYAVDVATFAVSLAALRMMRAVPPPAEAEPPSLARIREGLRYARSRPELMGTYIVDIVAMFFGMPMALFPAEATHLGGAGVLGLLYAAPAVGSLLATLTSGWVAHVHRHGAGVVHRRGRLGRRHHRLRSGAGPGAGPGRPGGGGRRRHGLGHLPRHDLEPDHPRPPARPPGRDRAGQLLDRAAARKRRVGRGGVTRRRARVGRLGRRPVRGGSDRRGIRTSGVLALRRPDAAAGLTAVARRQRSWVVSIGLIPTCGSTLVRASTMLSP